MEAVGGQMPSLLPFQVSRSKRGIPWRRLGHDIRMRAHPIIQTLSPDNDFAWNALFEDRGRITKQNVPPTANRKQAILPVSTKMMSKLGLTILPNRKACFAGKMLAGVKMPRHAALQSLALKYLLIWYLPCVEVPGNDAFVLNENCFADRENRFLKIYYLSLSSARGKQRYQKPSLLRLKI